MLCRGKVLKKIQTPYRIIVVLENITTQKKMENELFKSKKEAETSVKIKNQIIRNVSHEIKTPLNSIMGNLYGLKKKTLNEDQIYFLDKIERSSNKLLRLVNDMLDFTNSEKPISISEFDLTILLNNLFNNYNGKALEKKLAFSIQKSSDVPAILIGDNYNLDIVLTQLIDNAIKFTQKGSILLIVNKIDSEMNDFKLQFSVSDSGIGISNKDLSIIENNFIQIDGTISRKYEGMGIGLSLIKEKLKLLNSELKIKSFLDMGTIFKFIIDFKCSDKNQFSSIVYSNNDSLNDQSAAGNHKIVIKTPTPGIINELIKLTRLCSENNLKAVSFMEEVKQNKLKDYFTEKWIYLLEKSISNYDFDEALELLWEIDSM